MPNSSFYPDREGDQADWLQNLRNKIVGYTAPLQITPAELLLTQNDLDYLIFVKVLWQPAWIAYAESATAYRDQLERGEATLGVIGLPPFPTLSGPAPVAPGALTRTFERIARWKTAPGCTPPIMEDLRIKGTAPVATTNPPVLTPDVQPDMVFLNFFKHGHMGIYVESRRQGEETWADMGICVRRPFRDTRAVKVPGQAEWREYRARYWNNEPIGDWSNVVRVTVNP